MVTTNDYYDKFELNDAHMQLICQNNPQTQKIRDIVNNHHVFYMFNQAEEIIRDEIFTRFRDADKDTNNRGRIFFLYGDYNTGKSSLLKYAAFMLYQKFNPYWLVLDTCPIHIIDLRDDINTAKQFLLYLLAELGYPIDPIILKNWDVSHIAEVRLREKVISVLEKHQTRLLILDECQRLLKARNPNIPNIFECIKDLTTKAYWSGTLRSSIILCGTHDGLPLLEAADWIQGRAHSIKMHELNQTEYAYFLWVIYTDFINLGISSEWNLAIYDENKKDYVLNPEIASFLFQRTKGKVGLTVEIVREAIKRALNQGKLHPSVNDYKYVILEGKNYQNIDLRSNSESQESLENTIMVGINDRICKIKGCPQSRKPYAHYNTLIHHYKLKHPNVQILISAGERV